MQKIAMGKRIAAAVATASLAGGLGLAGAAPALADAPAPLSFTIDYTKATSIPQTPTLGGSFAGNGPVLDASGKQIGKTFDTCGVDGIESPTKLDAQCGAYVIFANGDELNLSAQAPIDVNPLDYPYTFKAVVEGGTGAYNGVNGEATVTAQKPGVYKVDVQFK
ncbi:hypothetical protein EOT10_16475 [Streptomyces antnestii]|uniref:Allene oxide cyclase n=1 Tax=Streptomyces antnestii TaxID=2494256 RepID=A0A3S2YZN7_9ACTN|nr:hypothetical protein [Streptomyces sp. San01]RVU23678.1 hypothetical protein EOT10_16475 [Streptomyces sp. San01]